MISLGSPIDIFLCWKSINLPKSLAAGKSAHEGQYGAKRAICENPLARNGEILTIYVEERTGQDVLLFMQAVKP
jgi:hypothetical protein